MGWSITVGSVAGTAVRIHVTFLLLLVWIFGANYFSGGPPAAWGALVFVVLLFLCVLLHEFGHIFTARSFGVSTPDVILLPIGGVSRLERTLRRPFAPTFPAGEIAFFIPWRGCAAGARRIPFSR